jgi:DNA-binding ferritin-like protein
MKTPEDEEFERIERQQKELMQVATSLSDEMRNKVIEEVAQEIEKFKGFGEDTISSFAIYIRGMKK